MVRGRAIEKASLGKLAEIAKFSRRLISAQLRWTMLQLRRARRQ